MSRTIRAVSLLLLCATIFSYASANGWTPVKRGMYIDADLEKNSLLITTDSALGSGKEVFVYFYGQDELMVGGVVIRFTKALEYRLWVCSTVYTVFPTTPSTATKKLWKITVDRTSGVRLIVDCNDEEVLNTLISAKTCDWPHWKRWTNDIEKILFRSSFDTASDYYKLQRIPKDWKPVKRGVYYNANLENNSLLIKTDSALGSGKEVFVYFYGQDELMVGGVVIRFTKALEYRLWVCSTVYTVFPTTPSTATKKLWKITVDRTSGVRLIVDCNDEEVLNTLISAKTCDWPHWKRWTNDIEKILFRSSFDTASDYYELEPLPKAIPY